ncbi:MAG: LssY C-terminal domain-containing protein [Trichlorobacter sp.]|uniref:LssY C-terminal domain-containing protein n=1 Tax=Trichlorobacter sp. TaxID=2911007 RepID=UPI00256DD410|nr:LssY C-terminal domain-containing protein [Trichlorobacter sp.]
MKNGLSRFLKERCVPFTLGAFLFCTLLCLSGCVPFQPKEFDECRYLSHAIAKSDGDVTVTADILTRAEAEEFFGFDFVSKGIQPVWIKIENKGQAAYWFIPHRLDPEYYSAMEAANIAYGSRSSAEHKKIYDHFYDVRMPRLVPPKETSKGFVFTKFEPGLKHIVIKLTGKTTKRFMFALEIPGPEMDFQKVIFSKFYNGHEVKNLDIAGLRQELEKLPCCTTDAMGANPADPLNLAIVGDRTQVMAELLGRGWDLTETINMGSVFKMLFSDVFGIRYRTSPVSPLYLLGRPHDFAMQKARSTIDRRNHLRLWLSTMKFEGKPVWLGQISRDIGIKFTSKSPYFVTHEISENIDESRHYLVEDMLASNAVEKIGYIRVSKPSTLSTPRQNLTGDEYFTDGLMAVVFLVDRYVPYNEVSFLEWETPYH